MLRHFYASLLIASGQSVKAGQARLGHSSARLTLDTYGHLWPDDEETSRKAVERVLGAALAGSVSGPALGGAAGAPGQSQSSVSPQVEAVPGS